MSKIQIKRYSEVKKEELEQQVKYYERLLADNNIVEYDPAMSYPEFDLACEKFRNTCFQISALLGEVFNGSYDDIEKYKDDPRCQTEEAKRLRDDLNLYNSLCIHEANKIGLPPPYWFFKCWGINGY